MAEQQLDFRFYGCHRWMGDNYCNRPSAPDTVPLCGWHGGVDDPIHVLPMPTADTMCDPGKQHRHACPACHAIEPCDVPNCRFMEESSPVSSVTCSAECFRVELEKGRAGQPLVTCPQCGAEGYRYQDLCCICSLAAEKEESDAEEIERVMFWYGEKLWECTRAAEAIASWLHQAWATRSAREHT